ADLMRHEAQAAFDLEAGPLIRGRLVRMAGDDHVLLITMHHIVSDDWSRKILTRELSGLYAAAREGRADQLTPLPVQYADYALWQRRWLAGEVLERQSEYWLQMLADLPEGCRFPKLCWCRPAAYQEISRFPPVGGSKPARPFAGRTGGRAGSRRVVPIE
ncbi:condensation domain-containing protein, partial [Mesorhizobium sp. M0045]|uniref:condensation domain-containing protein n=1 Tax=Mesorhizobium sp. M0045 TaxID=2956857 RepID=UPI003335265A